jgi:hypothetical protein
MNFSFSGHVALLSQFLDRRQVIVDGIEGTLLNVQGKDTSRNRNREHFEQLLNACFFNLPGLPRELSGLKGQLAATHLADGFEPLRVDRYSCELDPLELTVRAYHHWENHRWPGKSGRLTYAQIIYAVFMLRQLEHLSLRIWDHGNDQAAGCLQDIQLLLDRLNEPAIATVFVRDARWLIHTAQGPLTRHLQPYFGIAGQISGSLTESDRRELHTAGAKLAGGHLRSQRRYRLWETHLPIDDPAILAVTRNSNSMDNALLVRDLVPLLEAYRLACLERDVERRLDLADAILQGISADPELCLTRLDLLGPCTMIEGLFIDRRQDGRARYTRMGEEHLGFLQHYGELIGQLAEPLRDDASAFDPVRHVYSPYGITYGFSADLLSNMAQSRLVSQPSFPLSLEDTFISRGSLEEKLARARGWEQLPTREGERKHFEHSAEWAAQTFEILIRGLEARALHKNEPNASDLPNGRLFVVPESDSVESLPGGFLPAGIVSAQEHCFTSDLTRGLSGGATIHPKSHMLTDRNEGRFLASAESDRKWFGISKIILTVLTSQGRDALMTDVPSSVIEVLRLTCPGLVMVVKGSGGFAPT